MKINSFFMMAALAAGTLQSCAQNKGGKVAMKDTNDSLAYSIGVGIGQSLMKQGLEDLNYEIMKQAILDQFSEKSMIDDKTADAFMRSKLKARADEKGIKVKVEGEKWMAENLKKEGVQQTLSGLQYKVVREGQGERPGPIDEVTVHYKGTLTDGRVFDSSYDRGEPISFRLNQVIPGWTEGLQLMQAGASYILYVPQQLAYGANPRQGGIIEPYMPLVFEVELIAFKK